MRKPAKILIRNVPAEFHRRLKARAAGEGVSMSDYILREVGRELGPAVDRPSRQEVLDGLRARPQRHLKHSAAEVIRAERGALPRSRAV